MKLVKTIGLSLIMSLSAFANDGSRETLDEFEVLTNPGTNNSAYLFPAGAGGSVLFNNGPLITNTGTGSGGLDESILQNTTLGMTTLGLGHTGDFRVADEFTVTGTGWNLETITFYAYQTGATASTITAVNFQIWDGVPGAPGSSVVFGDDTTNRMVSTVNSNILRVTEDTSGSATNRQIAASTVDAGVSLAPGTYWIDWQSEGSEASGPWAPPVTIPGQTTTGNAMQANAGTWGDIVDGATATALGLPFVINGTLQAPAIIPVMDWLGYALLLLLIVMISRRFMVKV